ncbi:MAG: radical SAM protein [Gemmatimonadetes bacterium]|nr:radical SAM protein [Gemmatimonadota bacterium]
MTLATQHSHPAEPVQQMKRLESLDLSTSFEAAIATTPLGELRSTEVQTLQINVGKRCNQECRHCHVGAGPDRREVMPDEVVDACLSVLCEREIPNLDITGGAPELHPRFEEIITTAARAGRHVMDRCNLTILTVPAYRHLPRFLGDNRVEVVCSLPYYNARETDAQRGDGVFQRSIEALRMLNEVGYGRKDGKSILTLVANPVGAFLPAPQSCLEDDFREELRKRHGVEFSRLITIANMPIARYLDWLDRSGNTDRYMAKLVSSFNGAAALSVMCRNTISVRWDGALYDCDFNQMLDMKMLNGYPGDIFAFDGALLHGRRIAVGPHCFGCTAGQGSSCGGATANQ